MNLKKVGGIKNHWLDTARNRKPISNTSRDKTAQDIINARFQYDFNYWLVPPKKYSKKP